MKKTAILTAILAACSLTAAETVLQESSFSYAYTSGAGIVDDSAAVDKKAGKMDSSKGWTLICNIPKELFGSKEITVSLRTDAKDSKGVFTVGIYNKKVKKIVLVKRLKAADYAKETYTDVPLGKWELKEGEYFFVGSLIPKATANIFVDKITFK